MHMSAAATILTKIKLIDAPYASVLIVYLQKQ